LKKLLLILSFIAFTTLQLQAQSHEVAAANAPVVKFYPNPATTVINFELPKGSEKGYSLQIYNFMGGRKMFEQNNLSDHTTINLSDFSRGVYIFQLRDKTGRIVESGKFQVSK
jgi:hypothetical protein